MSLDHQLAIVESFRAAGLLVTLCITSAEVRSFSAEDEASLRELGATDGMVERLRNMADEPGQIFELDFTARTVTVYTGHFG